MTIQEYIAEVQKQFSTGVAREHAYRPALQQLLSTLLSHLIVSNDPARRSCGAPDYILMRQNDHIPILFVEAKDIDDKDLAGKSRNKEQFERYKQSLDNIIFTDYLDFRFYEKGAFFDSIRIAEVNDNKIIAKKENFEKFKNLIEHFGAATPQKITHSSQLAKIMAGKARLLANVIENVLANNNDDENSNLNSQIKAFKNVLIHDISPKAFADVYAQTITYGMFAARLHDPTPETFSRSEAATLIPKTNPFLRQLFQNIAGYDLDERICWIVDDLAETFHATDMPKIMSGFGKRTKQNDPMIHFYEDFLSAYDPSLRKSRGVWYTPQPVVSFIVRAVDDILQNEFKLPMGIADTSKISIKRQIKGYNAKTITAESHRVQILDPATGTGTFLAEVVSQIHKKFAGQPGMWQGYVEEHLIPRLHGFELLMASYTMAHLKIDWLLTETGYKPIENKRLRIFLTNSLEEDHKDAESLFAQFLAQEANGANEIKRNAPVMVILGNPPYKGESQNNGDWIKGLMEDYKKEPNSNKTLQERNPKWINNDYCKFIRLGQEYVKKNKEGVLAYINGHNFLDNPTSRGMRWNLMKCFDKIYIVDLHGSYRKTKVCPDGTKDENIFDIQEGVSINIFIKNGNKSKNGLAEVYHYDLYGTRQMKYEWLAEHTLEDIPFSKLSPKAPSYLFIPRNNENEAEYNKGFSITDLIPIHSVGIVTARDALVIDANKENLLKRILLFADETKSDEEIRTKFFPNKAPGKCLPGDNLNWSLSQARKNIKAHNHSEMIREISYRPFDTQYIYYSSDMIERGREKTMNHFLLGENWGLLTCRQSAVNSWEHVGITKNLVDDCRVSNRTKERSYVFPLYLYDEEGRHPNLKPELVVKIARNIGLKFEKEKSDNPDKFSPIDLLDYIYAVLHSPTYRKKYTEFLKTDFPRIPYPTSTDEFRRLAGFGCELRKIHLMEHPDLQGMIKDYLYQGHGNNVVDKVYWEKLSEETGRVWINDTQYFDNIPLSVWAFYIGGYQPAQKWLKDRVGNTLVFTDLSHYQRIIKALAMTDKIMKEINC